MGESGVPFSRPHSAPHPGAGRLLGCRGGADGSRARQLPRRLGCLLRVRLNSDELHGLHSGWVTADLSRIFTRRRGTRGWAGIPVLSHVVCVGRVTRLVWNRKSRTPDHTATPPLPGAGSTAPLSRHPEILCFGVEWFSWL